MRWQGDEALGAGIFLGLGSLALAAGICIFLDFLIGSKSHVRHRQGLKQVTIRHVLAGG